MSVLSDVTELVCNYPNKESDFYEALVTSYNLYKSAEDVHLLPLLLSLKRYPVSAREFFTSTDFIGEPDDIYPEVLDELVKICEPPHGVRIGAFYTELVATGGIGSAKTSIAIYTTLYLLYVLSCYDDPRTAFGQDKTSELIFSFQSISGKTAKDILYSRFRRLVEHSPYFNTTFKYKKDVETKLLFPNGIVFSPFSSDPDAIISGNIMAGVLDECNHLEIIEKSKRGDGGTYNQVKELYNSLVKRRTSRFAKNGYMPMMVIVAGSRKFPGQFTDLREEAAKEDPTIYVYDKRSWDIQPKGSFSGKKFPVFIGGRGREPRILTLKQAKDQDKYPEHLIDWVPVELKQVYQNNIYDGIRDHSGISTVASNPFFSNLTAVEHALRGDNLFTVLHDDLSDPQHIIDLSVIDDLSIKRWVHLDLSINGDVTGFGIAHCTGFRQVKQGREIEFFPQFKVDGLIGVVPDHFGEVNYENVRNIIYYLKEKGLNIRWVSGDSTLVIDTLQQLFRKGYRTGRVSVDKTMNPYLFFRKLINNRDVILPKDPTGDGLPELDYEHNLYRELSTLEYDVKKGKVDHREGEKKDLADALCGCFYSLSLQREVWRDNNAPVNQKFIKTVAGKDE